jgi:hypothetical protein
MTCKLVQGGNTKEGRILRWDNHDLLAVTG